MTPPQTFRSLFLFFESFITLYRLLVRPDQDREAAQNMPGALRALPAYISRRPGSDPGRDLL